MATYTENYSLVKPGYGDQADIDVLNRLMTDKVDALLFENRRISADEYDQEESYAVGDYAIYENVLYKCLEDTTGNFDPSKWEMTNLAKEVSTKGGADVTKTASGNPITFDDGADAPLVKCVTAITGSQDLHGYDKPWVGGAGKNKLPLVLADIKSANTNGTWSDNVYTYNGVTFTVLTDADGNITGIKANGTASSQASFVILTGGIGDGMVVRGTPANGSTSTYYMMAGTTSTRTATETGSGATISGTTDRVIIRIETPYNAQNLIFYPMLSESGASASFEPYSNICPITAYTEGEIEVRGRNLLDETIAHTNDRYWAVGTPSTSSSEIDGTLTLSAGTYTFSVDKVCQIMSVSCEDSQYIVQYNVNKVTFTITYKQGVKIALVCATSSDLPTTHMLNTGQSSENYEEFRGTTHTTTYPSAIYRGSEDVVNGTETHDMVMIDLGSLSWTYSSQYNRFQATLTGYKKPSSNKVPFNAICSCYETVGANYTADSSYDSCIGANSGSDVLVVRDTRYTDATAFTSAVTGQTLAYELVTPTTTPVTPTNLPIKSLSGYNHIESSTGEMEVEYITEEYQPIVDLIEESGGDSHTYSTSEQIVGKWIDGSTLYQKTIIFDNVITLTSDTFVDVYDLSTLGVKDLVELTVYTENTTPYRPFTHYFTDITSANILRLNAVSNGWYIGGMTIRYTKTTTPTRSLNLTKSAVEEIPDEIKNAPFEEKPDVNEADDDAPTEVDER